MAKGAELEVVKMKILEERIKAPCIWGRLPCNIRFEDLQDTRFDSAVQFLKKYYLPEQITYKSVKISEDLEGVEEFCYQARIWLKDKMSIAAVNEDTNKLIGVLIMRIQEKSALSRTFSRVKLTYNEKYTTVVSFNRAVEKDIDLFEKLDVKRYLKMYVLGIKPKFRHRGIAKELLKSAEGLCASAKIPALSGIFTTAREQQIAEEVGFKKYKEIYYIRYLINEKIVFWDTGLGNYGAALMAYRIPNIEESQDVQAQASSRFSLPADVENEEEEDETPDVSK